MLQWRWENKIGEVVFSPKQNDTEEKKEWTLNLYEGNAMLIMVYEYKENGKNMYQVNNFLADKEHAKNMFGISKGYTENCMTEYTHWKLDVENYRYTKDLVDMIIKSKTKTTIELY